MIYPRQVDSCIPKYLVVVPSPAQLFKSPSSIGEIRKTTMVPVS